MIKGALLVVMEAAGVPRADAAAPREGGLSQIPPLVGQAAALSQMLDFQLLLSLLLLDLERGAAS